MSSAPACTTEIRFKKYYHLKLTKKDWCSYPEECWIENNVSRTNYCWVCKYYKKLDIPNLLSEKGNSIEKNNICTAVSNSK